MISAQELEDLVCSAFEARVVYEEKKRVASEAHAEYEAKCQNIIQILSDMGLPRYVSKKGIFSYKAESSWKVPKTNEERELFFTYLKEKGLFDQMISVNSASLNSWAKQEEQAFEGLDFQIPGLEKSGIRLTPSLRKG